GRSVTARTTRPSARLRVVGVPDGLRRKWVDRTKEGGGAMKGQRKRTWIDPFQTGLLVRIAVYLLAFQTVAWAFFALCDQANAALAARGAGVAYLRSSLARSLLSLLLLAPPLALEAVRFAHRLVGPLYRFRKALQAIAAG